MPTPHCGQCDYNLTGIEDNRCPECGRLFVEVGVRIVGERRRGRRKHIWMAVILGGFLLAGISVSYALMARARMQAAVARRQVLAARQQALAVQQQQRLKNFSQRLGSNDIVSSFLSGSSDRSDLLEAQQAAFDALSEAEQERLLELRKEYEAYLTRRRAEREAADGDAPDTD